MLKKSGGIYVYFPSKKDAWMGAIIWLCIVALSIPPIFFQDKVAYMLPGFMDQPWIRILLPLIPALLLLWIWVRTGYTIQDRTLLIKCGPIKKSVQIHSISKVRKTRHPFTAPALSLDRLEVYYDRYRLITISPRDQEAFIQLLQQKNANIKIEE
jgi:hypothetical protein